MSENRKTNFIRQGTILAAASIIVRLIGIVYRIPVANIIGDEGNGIYGAAYEIYNLALILSSYSLPLAVSKLLSAQLAQKQYKNSQRTFYAALVFSCISGGVMALFMFFGAGFIEKNFYSSYAGISIPLKVLAITVFVVALLGVFRGYCQARKTMIPTAVSQIIEQIVNAAASIGFAILFLKLHSTAAWGAAGSTMGTLLGAAMALILLILIFVIYQPTIKKQMRRDKHREELPLSTIYISLFATIIPVILGQTVYQLSGVIDSMMFGKLYTGADTSSVYGVYSTKYKLLVNVPIAISSAMASSMIPTIVAGYTKRQYNDVRSKIGISVKFNMIIAFPCAVGLAVLGTPIVKMLFPGSSYELGGKMLMWGSAAVVFYALSTVTNAALQGINRMRQPVIHAAISLVVHIVLIFVLLKCTKLGIYALVIGNVTYPLLVCILNAVSLYRSIGFTQNLAETLLIPAAASALMGLLAGIVYRLGNALIHSVTISCLLSIALAVVVYFILIIVLGGIKEKDLPDFPMGMRIGRLAKKLHLM